MNLSKPTSWNRKFENKAAWRTGENYCFGELKGKGKEGPRTRWPKNGIKGSHRNKHHSDNDSVFQRGGIVSGKNCLTNMVGQVTCNNCYLLMSSSGMQTLYWLGIKSVLFTGLVLSQWKSRAHVKEDCKHHPPPPPKKKGQRRPINLETCLVVVASRWSLNT